MKYAMNVRPMMTARARWHMERKHGGPRSNAWDSQRFTLHDLTGAVCGPTDVACVLAQNRLRNTTGTVTFTLTRASTAQRHRPLTSLHSIRVSRWWMWRSVHHAQRHAQPMATHHPFQIELGRFSMRRSSTSSLVEEKPNGDNLSFTLTKAVGMLEVSEWLARLPN